jgi:glycosyltransferase involved in cell wall biosynthesis
MRPTNSDSSSTLTAARPTPPSPRVIHILKHCGYGNGNVHVAVDLACVQARAGYDVTVISSGGTFVPLLEQYGVRHIVSIHDQQKPWAMLRTAWRLTLMARKNKPLAIHAHMMSSALVGFFASVFSGVPLVTTVHNSFDKHSVIMRLGTRVVAVSKAEETKLLGRGYNKNKLCTVLNAPDQSPRDAFMDEGKKLAVTSPCIVAANGLHHRKGVADLIQAFSMLTEEFPQWTLYIAGEGPDRPKLEQQVVDLGLSNRVQFLGFLRSPRKLMEHSDIFVLASYAEPGGLSLAEARSAGCAIISTKVDGIPEMLDHGRAGRLVEPGRPDHLALELRNLMSDDEARIALGLAAKEGSEIFNVRRLVQDYEAVYMQANSRPYETRQIQIPHDEVA